MEVECLLIEDGDFLVCKSKDLDMNELCFVLFIFFKCYFYIIFNNSDVCVILRYFCKMVYIIKWLLIMFYNMRFIFFDEKCLIENVWCK